MEFKSIAMADIALNEGQIEGLPKNPRQWTKKELERLERSIQETPELLEARGLIVYPHKGKYIILGGNMRYSALKALHYGEAPCVVIPEDTSIEKLKEIVIKDNGSFGEWDWDMLANEWDDNPLKEWGVDVPEQKEEKGDTLREDFSKVAGTIEYEPKEIKREVSELYVQTDKFDKMIDALANKELAAMLRIRAHWFCEFDFAKIADYYAYQATEEEQEVIEALGLVLLDKEGLIKNGYSEIAETLLEEMDDEEIGGEDDGRK